MSIFSSIDLLIKSALDDYTTEIWDCYDKDDIMSIVYKVYELKEELTPIEITFLEKLEQKYL